MTTLADHLEVRARSVRAVSLETDLTRVETLQGFSAGAHVVDATRQITAALQTGPRPRAWSLTGPYGAGKSTYAVFLAALFGATGQASRAVADDALRRADSQLAKLVGLERRRLGPNETALVVGAAVARREPTALALSRALLSGAESATAHRRGPKPAFVHELAQAVTDRRADADLVLRSAAALAALAPTLIVVDELGKTLEFAADGSGEDDLYLLQQLAEQVSSSDEFRCGVLTLQHLAFEDYLVGAGEARRREWRKVHGRFEDIAFVPNRGHGVMLVADALHWNGSREAAERIAQASGLAEADLQASAGHIAPPSAYAGEPAATYPLHPLAALTLPSLAAQLGQHDRSLVSFLAGDSTSALRSRLSALVFDEDRVPFVRLADLYDFFFADGVVDLVSGPEGARLREIRNRVDGADQLVQLERDILKAVAVLNVVGGRDAPAATEQTLIDSTVGPDGSSSYKAEAARIAVAGLEDRGLLTFRRFAGEYRIWQGSDFDIASASAAARERLGANGSAAVAQSTVVDAFPMRPVVAQRYSQEHHVLRYFECRFAGPDDGLKELAVQLPGADGLVVYVLARDEAPSRVPYECTDGRPLVVVWGQGGRHIEELALDLAAARTVLDEAPELERDAVARQELRFRIAALRDRLTDALQTTFAYETRATSHFARGRRRTLTSASQFSSLVSELCDERFPKTPVIRNEMVNRRELTSQGAKARRDLLQRIFEHANEECLGIEGYGPERAMYEALLKFTGLHESRDGRWGFGPPAADSALSEVWTTIMAFFDDAATGRRGISELYVELQAPPFGLKDGPIPLLLSVALQYRSDDVFLYQDGTFQPTIEVALIERLLKAPERFSVKRAALLGIRGVVFEQLRDLVLTPVRASATTRNATTLAVVRPLMAFAQSLPEYVRSTDAVSSHARAVCHALLNATEPDELLFVELPGACELPPVLEAVDHTTHSDEFVQRLRRALAELGGAYQHLLDRIGELMRVAFVVADDAPNGLREDLRSRSARLVGNVIDPKLRAFLLAAGDRNFDETEWVEAISMSLVSKPPGAWNDHDVLVFEALLAERAGWFRRLEELYFAMLKRADDSFDARKLTITAADGTEISQIVPIDKVTEQIAGAALTSAIAELSETLGAQRAETALTAALVKSLLTDEPATTAKVVSDVKHDKHRGVA